MVDEVREYDQAPLRLAIFLDRWDQPRWVHMMLRTLGERPELVQVALVVKDESLVTESRKPGSLAYRAYVRLDRAIFAGAGHVLERSDARGLLEEISTTKTVRKVHSRDSTGALVTSLRGLDLDVGLCVECPGRFTDVHGAFRWGVWAYHHGDEMRYRGGPPGFWEVFENDPVTASTLQQLNGAACTSPVLQRSYASTNRTSVARNQDNYYRKSSRFVLRALEELASQPERFETRLQRPVLAVYDRPSYRTPNNVQFFKVASRHLLRRVAEKAPGLLFRDRWRVGIGRLGADGSVDLHLLHHFQPPSGSFWADPFPVEDKARLFVFVEEYFRSANRGHISVLEVDPANFTIVRNSKVLVTDHHLSYPFVFPHRGDWYLLPEASESNSLTIYRATDFPWHWEPLHTVLDHGLVDPTILYWDHRWWLFGTLGVEGASHNDELYAFHSESPFGTWSGHPQNPVRSDVRGARPAGRFFVRDGLLYRPGQDCSERYGGGVVIHQVELSTDEYEERRVARLDPDWKPRARGVHTLNFSDNFFVVDVQMREPRFAGQDRIRMSTA